MYKGIKMVGLFLKKTLSSLLHLQCTKHSTVQYSVPTVHHAVYCTLHYTYTKVEVAVETGIFNKETPHFLPNGYVIE